MLYKSIEHKSWYPWLIAVLCLLTVTVSNGLTNAGLTVFDESLLQEFGFSVGELKLRDSINFLGAASLILLSGYLVDRIGYKPVLLFGLGLLSLAYFAYGSVTSLSQIYALHVMFAVSLACAGNMVAVVTAASNMPKRQSVAVGMTVAGTSFGGILLPPFANWLNVSVGWRDAMRLEAILPVVMVILLFLFVKNKVSGKTEEGRDAVPKGLSFAQALRSHQFYLVAAAGGLTFYAILALFSHLFLYMRSLGFQPEKASLAISLLSFAALTGKLASGFLSSAGNPYRVLKVSMLLMLAGLAGVLYLPDSVWLFLAVTGLGWGSLHTLYNYVLLALFGLKAAGKINASVSIAQSLGAGLGAAVTGYLFDLRGSYELPLTVVLAVMGAAVLLVLPLKPLASSPVGLDR